MEKNTYLDTKIKNTCNGCGVCALVCPKKCIKMIEDEEGFLYPEIDEKKCINCGKCRRYCANFNIKTEENEKAYIAINNSEQQLLESSSGGMFYILAQYTIQKGGVVFGVTYNKELIAVHEYAENINDCKKFCGSKYVRSDLKDSYIKVKEFLTQDRYVLFTGTACQISGLKRFLEKDYEKLILCDILCHANPSPKVFKLYIKNIENIKHKKVKNILFRSKENGWRNQTPIIEYEDGSKCEEKSYYKAFVNELINRPSCYNCKFASKRRITDFTIGDFWGIENIAPEINTENGVSLISVNTSKGNRIFDEVKTQMMIKEVNYDLVCSFNHYRNVKEHKNRGKFFKGISNEKINSENIIKYMNKYTKKSVYRKIAGKIKVIIKRAIK